MGSKGTQPFQNRSKENAQLLIFHVLRFNPPGRRTFDLLIGK
jgi:hypothetical protein